VSLEVSKNFRVLFATVLRPFIRNFRTKFGENPGLFGNVILKNKL